MRKVIFLLIIILSVPGVLWAADPLIGTWKLNVSKSKYPPNQPAPKEQTETYRELADGQIELTYQSIEKDGSSSLLIENFPLQGGVPKVLKDDSPFSFIQTRIAQDEWLVTYLIDGKQVITRHKKISKDGKTLTQTIRGMFRTINEGQPFEALLVLERQ